MVEAAALVKSVAIGLPDGWPSCHRTQCRFRISKAAVGEEEAAAEDEEELCSMPSWARRPPWARRRRRRWAMPGA